MFQERTDKADLSFCYRESEQKCITLWDNEWQNIQEYLHVKSASAVAVFAAALWSLILAFTFEEGDDIQRRNIKDSSQSAQIEGSSACNLWHLPQSNCSTREIVTWIHVLLFLPVLSILSWEEIIEQLSWRDSNGIYNSFKVFFSEVNLLHKCIFSCRMIRYPYRRHLTC